MAEEDRFLVQRAREGDREAIAGLFEKYRMRVIRFCLSFAPIREPDAHDLTQEVFVRALRGIGRLREVERFESWLFSIARRRCMTHLGKGRTRELQRERLEVEPDMDHEREREDERLHQMERVVVAEEIERLPDSPLKRAGRMFYIEGRDTGQIAVELAAPVSTVTTWLSRFRAKIRRRLVYRILELRGHPIGGMP